MNNKNIVSSQFKVGILVLIGILILFYMSFRIGKFGVFRETGYDITVLLDSANGLDTKSPVQIAGVEVGKIKSITLDGFKAMTTLTIKKGVRIPVDSKVVIKTQGVLGEKYIEIIPGKETQMLASGESIKEVLSTANLDEIFDNINVAAKNFGETMGDFKGLIGDTEKENIKKSLANINRLADSAARLMSEVEEGKGTLGLLVKDDTLYKDAKDTMASLKSISSDIEQGKGTLGKLAKDDTIYNEAKETISNIKEITEGIKQGEGTLGKLAKDDSLYTEGEKTMKKLQKGAEGLQEMTPITILGTILGTLF
jgi:phospholipid/cholesterol/gamma-HCH transport system substrate-binding protein